MATSTDPLSDLRQLEPQALGALHDRYFPELYRYARYRLGDSDSAEDAASEVFLRLLEAIHGARGPRSSLRGWLYGTLRHIVDDHYRAAYARAETEPPAVPDSDAPDTAFEVAERQRQVRRAMSQLTSEQQHVLALRFGGAYSLQETAELMGRNVNAVKALQFRALQALRRGLAKEPA
jgi:RNA polymerase sigma-70 factor (ECF subfamily)